MKTLLNVTIGDNMEPVITCDYDFPQEELKTLKINRKSALYRSILIALQDAGPEIMKAIRLLDHARNDARFKDYRGLNPDIEDALIAWRKKKARELGQPAYIILSQQALLAIADTLPSTREELLAVPGVGEIICEKFGNDILDITSGCIDE